MADYQHLPLSKWTPQMQYAVWQQQRDIQLRSMSAPLPAMHTDGLIAEWRFAEGSGTTVADSVAGTYPINLNLPTTPNYAWNSKGIALAAGLVQPPNIATARTIAFLYRVTRGEGGGVCTGVTSSGTGWFGNQLPPLSANEKAHVGIGNGVRPARSANAQPIAHGPQNGTLPYILNRGGWVLGFREFAAAAGAQSLGLGGRPWLTTNRCATFDIAWAGVWNDALTDAERTAVYDAVRARYAKPRGIYLDWRDCPSYADVTLLWGQSNADGRALISGLSAPDQAVSYTKVYIEPARGAVRGTPPPALLALGTNQKILNVATEFGPEIGAALLRQGDGTARPLYIMKTAEGSTYAADPVVGAPVTPSNTWHPLSSASFIFHQALCLDWYDMEQRLLTDGIGPRLRALWWMQGEQDATTTVAAPNAAAHQANLQAIADAVRTYSGNTSLPVIVARIRDVDPSMNATAKAAVRAGQAAFVSANPGTSALIDTDDLTLGADNVHYVAASMKTLGGRFYSNTDWS